jgi:nitrate reductase cytochrome c-type subunit
MNKLVALLVASMMSIGVMAAEKEKVCIDVKDAKTGKVKQECKMMKKHQKLEGTKVPEKK